MLIGLNQRAPCEKDCPLFVQPLSVLAETALEVDPLVGGSETHAGSPDAGNRPKGQNVCCRPLPIMARKVIELLEIPVPDIGA